MVRLLAGIFSFLALGGIAALGGIGVVIWLYAQDLPSYERLAAYEPATLSRVYSAEGDLLAEFARQRSWVLGPCRSQRNRDRSSVLCAICRFHSVRPRAGNRRST